MKKNNSSYLFLKLSIIFISIISVLLLYVSIVKYQSKILPEKLEILMKENKISSILTAIEEINLYYKDDGSKTEYAGRFYEKILFINYCWDIYILTDDFGKILNWEVKKTGNSISNIFDSEAKYSSSN